MKTCTKCKEAKPLESFSKKSSSQGTFRSRCKSCTAEDASEWRNSEETKTRRREYMRDYRRSKPNKFEKEPGYAREYRRSLKYGIQNSVGLELKDIPCMICKEPAPGPEAKRSHAIDHCHRTGAVRGTLCYRCNMIIGYVEIYREDPSKFDHYLSRQADYRDVDLE